MDTADTEVTAGCDMASPIMIVVVVFIMEATTEPMEVDMEDHGPIGLIGPMDGPNGSICLTGGSIGMYEPKSPTLPILSYDSYDPLSCF